jgi:hypothetical protein
MGKTNKAWHEMNPMPRNATVQQRIDWHIAHADACGCRPMPPSIRELVEERRAAGEA